MWNCHGISVFLALVASKLFHSNETGYCQKLAIFLEFRYAIAILLKIPQGNGG